MINCFITLGIGETCLIDNGRCRHPCTAYGKRRLSLNKTILKTIEYSLTIAGLLIGMLFLVLIIRGT